MLPIFANSLVFFLKNFVLPVVLKNSEQILPISID